MKNDIVGSSIAVSVIIPVYNVASWLDECLESVEEQSLTNFEVILVDDGSTDGSAALCDAWAKRDERIRVIHKENEGPSIARNRGIAEAKGSCLTFLDSDDKLDPMFLEKMYGTLAAQEADLAECDVWRLDSRTGNKTLRRISGVMGREYSLEEQMEYGYTAIWKCMFRRGLFMENDLRFPNCHSEARALYPLLLCLSKKRVYIPEPLYCYRLFREGSLSAAPRKTEESGAEGIRAYEILIENFRQYGFYEDRREVLKKLILVKLSDLLAAFFTQRQPEEFAVLTEEYRGFIQKNFPEYADKSYLTVGGYNLNRIMSHMNLLHDPSGRINFSSLVSVMRPVKEQAVFRHKNRYRQLMLEREADNRFWTLMEERRPDFVALDFIEERFDLAAYGGGFLTKSDAFEGCEERPEEERTIVRDSGECTKLWQESALAFIDRMEKGFPDTEIVLIKNYLAEKKGDTESQEYFADLEEIRKINRILEQYYRFFEQHCKKVKTVEASACRYYFTDREYEYGVIPSHLNELVNREIAKKTEECVRE